MVDILARCTLRPVNGVPADECINTFAVIADGLASLEAIAGDFAFFYNAVNGGAPYALSEYIADTVLRVDGLLVELIDSPQTPPNAPLWQEVYTLLPAASSSPLPQEVSICSSWRTADYLTSANPGRERGRIYFGPLDFEALDDGGTNQPARPSAGVITALVNASESLALGLNLHDAALAVWSRAAGTFKPVAGGWVDNEFDTQRRRGRPPTGRTHWNHGG